MHHASDVANVVGGDAGVVRADVDESVGADVGDVERVGRVDED